MNTEEPKPGAWTQPTLLSKRKFCKLSVPKNQQSKLYSVLVTIEAFFAVSPIPLLLKVYILDQQQCSSLMLFCAILATKTQSNKSKLKTMKYYKLTADLTDPSDFFGWVYLKSWLEYNDSLICEDKMTQSLVCTYYSWWYLETVTTFIH